MATSTYTNVAPTNNAGGATFKIDDFDALRRFLILGSEGGTYYASEKAHTFQNYETLQRCLLADGPRTVRLIADVSIQGLAPKNTPAVFALAIAIAAGDTFTKRLAADALPTVCRIPTDLFFFVKIAQERRGWGNVLRDAVANWYQANPTLEYHSIKYRQRDGWTHRDLLRLSHPKTDDADRQRVFQFMAGKAPAFSGIFPETLIEAFLAVQGGNLVTTLAVLDRFPDMPWEALPTEHLNEPEVWNKLLDNGVPMRALLRQLPRLTKIGVAQARKGDIAKQFLDGEVLRKSRLHPLTILNAHAVYTQGGAYSDRRWSVQADYQPVSKIADALNDAFYLAFGNVTPTNKRTLLALDVSGSMMAPISGTGLTARSASAALALVTAAVEPDHEIVGFTSDGGGWSRDSALVHLDISPKRRLDDVIGYISGVPFGGTDCALPFLVAEQNNAQFDSFVLYTDNETWAGQVQPHVALKRYRASSGIDAKSVVVGMTSTGFSIADPKDPGMLDVVGFDLSTPELISQFLG